MPEITYGTAVKLSPRLSRITAPNAGQMTGPGTNSYIVGHDQLALVDPGPALGGHIDAIVDLVGDRLKWILVTHTHPDHSPAAAVIAERTGAELIGNVIENDGRQDASFTRARAVAQDERLKTPEFTLRALLTPGHVSNHVCYLLEEDRILMTGDHIMGGSTVVIIPPAGNMKHYIESLQRMLEYDVEFIAPGHGDLIGDPKGEIRYLVQHRLKREQKVIAALERLGGADIGALTPVVYDDVDPSLHPWAALSLHAHLLKLEAEARALVDGERWSLAANPGSRDR